MSEKGDFISEHNIVDDQTNNVENNSDHFRIQHFCVFAYIPHDFLGMLTFLKIASNHTFLNPFFSKNLMDNSSYGNIFTFEPISWGKASLKFTALLTFTLFPFMFKI